jgi:hypothetical protein
MRNDEPKIHAEIKRKEKSLFVFFEGWFEILCLETLRRTHPLHLILLRKFLLIPSFDASSERESLSRMIAWSFFFLLWSWQTWDERDVSFVALLWCNFFVSLVISVLLFRHALFLSLSLSLSRLVVTYNLKRMRENERRLFQLSSNSRFRKRMSKKESTLRLPDATVNV